MAELLLSTSFQMESTLGPDKTITAISKVAAAIVTATHDFSVGDYIKISDVSGMTEINDRVVRVSAVSTTVSFTCEALDSTNWSTYTSGGTANKVTAWHTFANVSGFNYTEPQPNAVDVTTIHGAERTELNGLDSAPTIEVPMFADPTASYVVALRTYSLAKTKVAFKVTLQSGKVLIFNAQPSGGRGAAGNAGDALTASATLKLAKPEQWFAS